MLNVYNGNATLDGRGEAVVMLPAYFEALNKDFRYQLTPLGAPGPNLYIAQEIRGNRFVITGRVPGARSYDPSSSWSRPLRPGRRDPSSKPPARGFGTLALRDTMGSGTWLNRYCSSCSLKPAARASALMLSIKSCRVPKNTCQRSNMHDRSVMDPAR